ncbi:MmcQ/YjbR family DNA-binding protein [Sphingomonas sp. TDK1]|uniref:MmcQ/YjbR family DNA-binding protein n=1 Tax=Sphingomonas sp. TDK1 TaxID=453247 RepID=UPI0007D903D0|nr:hypothetical protein [Sphingomonas sp. TDK1]OAN67215.1 hypothetical protein A7X12_00930 [Sphingomonas sp. TDK1]
MDDWEDACAYACSLPEVEIGSWWNTPCPKINGKGLLSPSREPGSFGLMIRQDEKPMLLETDPETFWQTDHYRNYPMLLVRYGTSARARIELYIQRAWWDRAKKAQRLAAGLGTRP